MKASVLAHELGARLLGEDRELEHIRRLECASSADLSLLLTPQDRRKARHTQAGALLLSVRDAAECADELTSSILVHDSPHEALALAIELLYPKPDLSEAGPLISPLSHVGQARIGAGTRVMPFAYLADDVEVGQDCLIGPGSVLLPGVCLGDRVILQANVVLGADGFVYDGSTPSRKLRSLCCVEIGSDVEIGAGSCVDRGFLEPTRIGAGSKIDNLVQIGHDVSIGPNSIVVAQAAIGGHATLGAGVSIGGQSGIGPHRMLGEGARLSPGATLFHDLAAGEVASGSPAQPHLRFLRNQAVFASLSEMRKELLALRAEVACLNAKD